MTTKRKRTQRLDYIQRLELRTEALEEQLGEFLVEHDRQGRDWFKWRKATSDLIDMLDRGLRKLEERTEVLENADHGSFVAALSKLEEQLVSLTSRHVALNASLGKTNDRLAALDGDKKPPSLYSLSIPTEAKEIQATVEWRDARPDLVNLHVGDFMHEMGAWCRLSKEQASQLVIALTRAIEHSA